MTMETLRPIATVALLTLFISCNPNKNEPVATYQSTSGKLQPEVLYYSSNQVDSILRVAVGDTSSIQNLGSGEILDSGEGGEPYWLIKRTVDGYVELHEQWDDVVIIRSGHGALRTGRKVTENKLLDGEKPWRNWYGGQIIDIKENKISPGDFIIIPAMTAHQYIPNKSDTLTYWTIKIKRTRNN